MNETSTSSHVSNMNETSTSSQSSDIPTLLLFLNNADDHKFGLTLLTLYSNKAMKISRRLIYMQMQR